MAAAKRICAAAFLAVLIVFSAAVYGPGVRYVLSCLPALAAADLSAPESRAGALAPIKEEFDLRTTSFNVFYQKMINVNSLFEMACGKRTYPDDSHFVAKLDNGHLAFVEPVSTTTLSIDTAAVAQDVTALKQFCDTQGVSFLYLLLPDKVSKYDPQLPRSLQDIVNPPADAVFAALDGRVPYIDLRQALHDAGIDQYDFFFRTDHHWTPEGAFWCCRYVTDVLRRECGLVYDDALFAPENYARTVYPQIFLGSIGKRVGSVVTGADDFTLISPSFATAFTRTFDQTGEVRRGAFEEVLLDRTHLHKDYYNEDVYSTCMGGTDAIADNTIINENAPNDTHILLIGDSFRCAFAPFLALACRQLTIHDPGDSDLPLDAYIKQTKPDIVIVMYYIRSMGFFRLFP